MNTKIRKIYYLVPFTFLLMTVVLLLLEFNNRDNSFNIQIGKIQLSGSGEQGLDKNNISNVKLMVPGLLMNLSKEPIMILHKDGNKTAVNLSAYDVSDSGFILAFSNSLVIKVTSNKTAGIVFDFEYPGETTDTLILPSEFMADNHQLSYLPCYTYAVSGINYMLSARNGSIFDKTAGTLILPFADKASSIVIDNIEDIDPLQYYFFGKAGPVSTDVYESTIESFIREAYEGWRNKRYNSSTGEWLLSDGEYGLNNNLLASFISESIKRGRFAQIENIVEKISDKKDEFSFLSAPFLGNIVNTNSSRIKADDLLKKKISKAAKLNDLTLFREPNLLQELAWISSSALNRDFSKYITSLNLNKRFGPATLTGMVEIYDDSIQNESKQYQELKRLYSVIEEQIFPSLTRINKGLFLSGGTENLSSTSLSIRTGIALHEIGQIESNRLFESIGRTMVVSVLSLADETGLIPEFIDRGGNPHGDTYFPADKLYSRLVPNEYYPHVVNFNGTAGTDISVWTVANTVSFRSDDNSSQFEFTYPRGSVHSLVIKGVEPFKSLRMNGINWNSDTRFQYYSSGWVYEREEKSLYIKLTQRQVSEKIVLNYEE